MDKIRNHPNYIKLKYVIDKFITPEYNKTEIIIKQQMYFLHQNKIKLKLLLKVTCIQLNKIELKQLLKIACISDS